MITARIARFLSPMWHDRYGLSVESWRILAVIGRYEPISAKEVATRSSSDAYHISRSVERLVRNGLVARNVDRKDRRRIRLQLTPAGRSAHTTIVRALTNVESELLVGGIGISFLSAQHDAGVRSRIRAAKRRRVPQWVMRLGLEPSNKGCYGK